MAAAKGSRNVIIHDEEWNLLVRIAERVERPRSWVLSRLVRHVGTAAFVTRANPSQNGSVEGEEKKVLARFGLR